jgi:hypothetical protein
LSQRDLTWGALTPKPSRLPEPLWRPLRAGPQQFRQDRALLSGCDPALIARELLIRTRRLHPASGSPRQRFHRLDFSASTSSSNGGRPFWARLQRGLLGTSGYVWDTQSDMFMALSAHNRHRPPLEVAGSPDRQIRLRWKDIDIAPSRIGQSFGYAQLLVNSCQNSLILPTLSLR